MPRYTITFEIDTQCSEDLILDAIDENIGQHLDNGLGTEMPLVPRTLAVELSTPILISMTYSTTTPESVEQGDHADHGFAEPGGWQYSIADQRFHDRCKEIGASEALAEMTPKPTEFETIGECADFLKASGPLEPSDSSLGPNTWLTQIEPAQDAEFFEQGHETFLSFHFQDTDPQVQSAVLAEVLS